MKIKFSVKHFFYGILLTSIISSIAFFYHDYRDYKKMSIEKMEENKKGIDIISSGMSLDEKRLRAVMQTDKIISDHNKKYNLKLKTEFIHSLAMIIVDASSKYPNIDHILLCALISQESRFNPNARSPVGARGLMQIMDQTAEEICYRFAWNYYDSLTFNPEKNIMMGAYYFNRLIDRNRGNIKKALANYNGGELQMKRYSFLIDKENGQTLDSLQELEVGKLALETKQYPDLVLDKDKTFRNKYSILYKEEN